MTGWIIISLAAHPVAWPAFQALQFVARSGPRFELHPRRLENAAACSTSCRMLSRIIGGCCATIAGRLSSFDLRPQPIGNSAGHLCRRLVRDREHRTDVDLAEHIAIGPV